MIFWNHVWSPICGHYFWDNHIGATKFCQKLGYISGKQSRNGYLKSAAICVGRCLENDDWDTKCSGEFNEYLVGPQCHNSDCGPGDDAGIAITCQGK